MANLLWGKVFYKDHFAGILREEPGDNLSFQYDRHYIDSNLPAIAHSLPLQTSPITSYSSLHPYFDNLIAEGWLESAQIRSLGKREADRFELLLAFGYDLIGAISVIDPEPEKLSNELIDRNDLKSISVMRSIVHPIVKPEIIDLSGQHQILRR